jgi:hypothetical protein
MANSQPQSSSDFVAQDLSWSSAPNLSTKVRELAHSAHSLLKGRTVSPGCPEDIGVELRALSEQVARLRRKIHERELGALIPWVDALQRQVDDRLG